MIYPLSHAIITQYFGEHPDDYLKFGYPGHNGIDLVTDDSPPLVYAFSGGRCLKIGWQQAGYGKYIVIELAERQFYYCHLAEVYLKPGEQISQGEPIALMGSTGNSTGPHLHFGIRCTDGGGLMDYQGFMDPLQLLQSAQQPELSDVIPILPNKPPKPFVSNIVSGSYRQAPGEPVTHGKRTMYPRMKYY